MTTRTLLLTLHIVSAAGWLGADFVVHALSPRLHRESLPVQTAWAGMQSWMHERYYPVVAVLLLASGILLVLDGDWSWSAGFIWVGVGAIVIGATLGGGLLGSLSKQEHQALTAGDTAAASGLRRRMVPISIILTVAPIVAVLAMVDRWQA